MARFRTQTGLGSKGPSNSFEPAGDRPSNLVGYTRTYASGETSRARDLADILLAASLAEFDGPKLKQATDATFKGRASHPVPPQMPDPPERIAAPYRQVARELDLPWRTIEEAGEAVVRFLNPVLKADSNLTKEKWNRLHWKWT